MKGRLVFILSLLLFSGFAACGSQPSDTEVSSGTECTSPDFASDTDEGTEDDGEDSGETGYPILLYDHYEDYAVLVEEDGSAQRITLDGKTQGEWSAAMPCVDDGTVYYGYELPGTDDGTEQFVICAKDPGEEEAHELLTLDGILSALDVYDGVLCILRYERVRGYTIYGELVYEPDGAGGYQQTEGNLQLYEKLCGEDAPYDLVYQRTTQDLGRGTIYGFLRTNGELLVETEDDDAIVSFSESGEEGERISLLGHLPYMYAAGTGYLIYSTRLEDGEALVCHDRRSGRDEILRFAYDEILALDGDMLYYAVDVGEFGITDNQIYQYDLVNGTWRLLYESVQEPGTGRYYETGISGFAVQGERCFFVRCEETESQWYAADFSGEDTILSPLGVLARKYDFADYGTVVGRGERQFCADCNIVGYEYWAERFVLDDGYPGAEQINAFLANVQDGMAERGPDGDEIARMVHHGELGEEYWEPWYDEMRISSVYMIKDHYLAVNYDMYWYMGGVHGTPYTSDYLFDVRTGERIQFADLYTGSLEDFKQIVSGYTLNELMAQNRGADEAVQSMYEEIREDVCDDANYDLPMRFTEDGIIVEHYANGAFGGRLGSSIVFEVPIPYEVLGIEWYE